MKHFRIDFVSNFKIFAMDESLKNIFSRESGFAESIFTEKKGKRVLVKQQ